MKQFSVASLSLCAMAAALTVGSTTAANTTGLVDCSQFQQSAPVDQFQVRFTSVLDNEVGPNGYLHAEVSYPANGWISLGYSSNGKMVPGYAVIGLPGLANGASNPGKYNLGAEDVSGVTLLGSQTLENASVEFNSTHTVMKFTKRLMESSELTINGEGSNYFLVAYGTTTGSLSTHTARKSFGFSLQSCINGATASNGGGGVLVLSSSQQKQLWTAHGVFAAIAWGVLAPVAIAASLLRQIFIQSALPALWFKIHMIVNVTVFIFTALAFAFAVRATDLQQKTHFKGVQHRKTGLVIMILLCVQVLMGIFRPHLPHHTEPDEDAEEIDGNGTAEEPTKEPAAPAKSIQRILWEVVHRLLGFLLVGFAWWQVGKGLGLYSQYFSEKDLGNVFWGITAALSGVILILYILIAMNFL